METENQVKRKNRLLTGCALLVFMGALLFLTGRLGNVFSGKEKVITIGAFSDSYWEVQNGYSYRILDDAIEKYEAQHPGIRIEYTSGVMKEDYSEWLSEQVLKGTAPDLFFLPEENLCEFAQADVVEDLTDRMNADASFYEDRYYTAAVRSGVYEGAVYALPFECAPRLMFVNKTILEQEGIDMPLGDWTFDELYRICQRVTKDSDGDGRLDQFGITGYTYEDAFCGNGVTLFNEKGTECYFAGERVEESISLLERLKDLNQGYSVSEKDFDEGNVVFMPMLFSEYRAYKPYPLSVKKYAGFEWECLPMPAGSHGENISNLDTLLLAMNKKSRQKKEAFEFMKYLTGDEEIQSEIFTYSEGVSILRSVTESEQTLAQLLTDSGSGSFQIDTLSRAVEQAAVYPNFEGYEDAMKEVEEAVTDILEGDVNIGTGQIIWNRRINAFLKEKNIK